ncbi:hypothetical protein AB832_06930 [Flavobacteriaceae bacterium (ex Bugula neritina AB1)]|nr:hypothetical protein AB832_06930 [Flavobacteriaceae bacterium (ex Bugula neritina AB1)]
MRQNKDNTYDLGARRQALFALYIAQSQKNESKEVLKEYHSYLRKRGININESTTSNYVDFCLQSLKSQ